MGNVKVNKPTLLTDGCIKYWRQVKRSSPGTLILTPIDEFRQKLSGEAIFTKVIK